MNSWPTPCRPASLTSSTLALVTQPLFEHMKVPERLNLGFWRHESGVKCSDLRGTMFGRRKDGRGGAIRTPDLLNPIQVRYQTALRPDRRDEVSVTNGLASGEAVSGWGRGLAEKQGEWGWVCGVWPGSIAMEQRTGCKWGRGCGPSGVESGQVGFSSGGDSSAGRSDWV